jgi:putative SOS response-associated peptidase YedK
MCGRYTQLRSWSELVQIFAVATAAPAPNALARYNIAPTQDVAVVRLGASGRELLPMRWGLVPAWAKDVRMGVRLINARAESVAEKPAFRAALRARRCLIPADGFYEWEGQARGPKLPFRIAMADGAPFAFAGLWERWQSVADGQVVLSCTILTTEANAVVRPIHDRMPVILATADYDAWLDCSGHPATAVQRLLGPYSAAAMQAQALGPYVNRVAHDDARCLEARAAPH